MKADFRQLANNSIRHLAPYQPGKLAEELTREFGIIDTIKLASNENPLGPSPYAIAASQEAILSAHLYPDGGCYDIKKSLSTFLNVDTEQLVIGNGSENILELITKAYLHPGDTAVISQYAFLTIPLLIESAGAHANVVPTKHWQTDVYGMINAIDDKTRILFLVNPNNPTGTYTSHQDFLHLLNRVPPHILIVVDEAYADYINCDDYPNALPYLHDYPNLVITRTFSKVYGLAALRLGYSISSVDIADILNRTRLPFNVNAIACKAACAALLDQSHVQQSIALNQQGMQQLLSGLLTLKLNSIPSICNFITIEVGDAMKVYEGLLQAGVIIRPLQAYQLPHHIRVTIGTRAQNQRFLTALTRVMATLSEAISP